MLLNRYSIRYNTLDEFYYHHINYFRIRINKIRHDFHKIVLDCVIPHPLTMMLQTMTQNFNY
jgi:hypothetical protein